MDRIHKCTYCNGTGKIKCPRCGGYGIMDDKKKSICYYCQGNKEVVCSACSGRGIVGS